MTLLVGSAIHSPAIIPLPALRLVIDALETSGTWTAPAGDFWSAKGVINVIDVMGIGGGGGGQIATGGGGGGAFARGEVRVAPSTGYTVTVGAGGAGDGGDTSFESDVVAKGGLSRANGGTGGTAAASTGTTKYSGTDGTTGATNTFGGSAAGDQGAAIGTGASSGGPHLGGFSLNGGNSRFYGSGGSSTDLIDSNGRPGMCRVLYYVEATADYPRLIAMSWGRGNDATSRNITLPGGRGGKLLLIVGGDSNSTIGMAGWTQIGSQSNEGGNTCCSAVFYHDDDGAVPVAMTQSVTESVCWTCFRILNAGTPTATYATGSSGAADPPDHAPGSAKYLWLTYAAFDTSGPTYSGPPANYGDSFMVPALNAGCPFLATATRYLEAASENPGTFGNSTAAWSAGTISVPYAA